MLGAVSAQAQSTNQPPAAPNAPTVNENGFYALTVSWTEPASEGSAITGYDLQYRKMTEEDWIDGPQNQAGTSAEISGLEGDIAYEVRVRARNAAGDGNWSEPGEGTTAMWTATLTVGSLIGDPSPRGYWGYQRRNGTNFGQLSPRSLTYNGVKYQIFILAWYRGYREHDSGYHTSAVDFYTLENGILDEWVLRVDTSRFHTSDGLRATLGIDQKKIYWIEPEISLSLGEKYDVALSREVLAEKDENFNLAIPLTAEFKDLPKTHDGTEPFTLQLQFSEETEISYLTFHSTVFELTDGTMIDARRLNPPSNVSWEIIVQPSGDGAVSIALLAKRTCVPRTAICTASGKQLSERVEANVLGPETPETPEPPRPPETPETPEPPRPPETPEPPRPPEPPEPPRPPEPPEPLRPPEPPEPLRPPEPPEPQDILQALEPLQFQEASERGGGCEIVPNAEAINVDQSVLSNLLLFMSALFAISRLRTQIRHLSGGEGGG